MNLLRLLVVASITLLSNISSSHAQLLGTSVQIDWRYPAFATVFASASKTVVAAPEINCSGSQDPGDTPAICQSIFGGPFSIDIAASSITINTAGNMFFPSAYNGFRFMFGPGTPPVLGVTLVTNNGLATNARVSSTANSVAFNLTGLDPAAAPPHFYTLNIAFGAATTEVPTMGPIAAALLTALLMLIAALRLRRLPE